MDYPSVAEEGRNVSAGFRIGLDLYAKAETGRYCAQAQHASAPDIAGRNVASPTSLILSAAMMSSWLGEQRDIGKLMDVGNVIATAIDAVLDDPAKRTRDLFGSPNTDEFAKLVADAIAAARGIVYATHWKSALARGLRGR
ncbi:MAG: isocitrate/isopropylmalate family dehydrogenase [Gammaproteobacteria bacterium]